jgi:ABC-type multidrug transport system fused ATPase/permease subunit
MAGSNLRPLRYFRDQTRHIARLGFVALLSSQCQAITLILVVPLAKTIAAGKDHYHGKLGSITLNLSTRTLIAACVLSILAAAALEVYISWSRSKVMAHWELKRREAVIAEFLGADYPTQAGERLGTLNTVAGYVTRGSGALGAIINGLEAAITIAMFVVAAMLLDFRAAAFLLLALLLLFFMLRPAMQKTKKYSKVASTMVIDYGREVTEVTRMARDIRVFDALDSSRVRMTKLSRQLARLRLRATFVNTVTTPVYQYLGMLLVVVSLGVAESLHGLDLAVVGAVILLLTRSMSFGNQLQNAYQTYLDSTPYVLKLEEIRGMYLEHATVDGTVALEAMHEFELRDVRYSYDGEVEALAGVSVSFNRGEIVGIVGPSGGGKSTLSQVILRLRMLTGGSIFVNRVPAEDYTLASWYRHISLVPQDPRLMHASVADNIAFLDESISRETVIERSS